MVNTFKTNLVSRRTSIIGIIHNPYSKTELDSKSQDNDLDESSSVDKSDHIQIINNNL